MRVCKPIALNCDYCFTLQLQYQSPINVLAGLPLASAFYLWVRDKFGNQYEDWIMVNPNGSFDIDLTNYPAGMFNPLNGWVDIFITSDLEGTIIVPMIFGTSFNCLKLSTTC